MTFRVVAVTTDIFVVYFFTRNVSLSLGIALASNLASTLLYYVHERAWNRVEWGKEEIKK